MRGSPRMWDRPCQVGLQLVTSPPLYPLTFHPRFKERIWGGRSLASMYGKPLPPDVPIGESWEIADRPGDESVVANGPLAGRTLRALMEQRGRAILGDAAASGDGRFPLLCKILDAREKLSLQVHPPARARHLGDPKTEMWYIAAAAPEAELFVGLKAGITPEAFAEAVRHGMVDACFHRIAVTAGDAMFLPSGRVHAIGAGLVIFEIQQNSDTTFRVHDWNRVGLDGKPRELHVTQSLESIDFADVEPLLIEATPALHGPFTVRRLVDDVLFRVDLIETASAAEFQPSNRLSVIACVEGALVARGNNAGVPLEAGTFCLLPAGMDDAAIDARPGARFLLVEAG